MLLFDIFTLQGDRHPNNWGLIKTKTGYKACPLFDNSSSFGLGYPFMQKKMANLKNDFMYARTLKDYSLIDKEIYLSRPSFTLSNENIKNNDKQSALVVFQDFIRKTGTDSINYVAPFFQEMTEDNLQLMIGKIENENGIRMSDELSGYIYNIFNYHQQKLNTIMSLEYQGGSKSDTGKSTRRI